MVYKIRYEDKMKESLKTSEVTDECPDVQSESGKNTKDRNNLDSGALDETQNVDAGADSSPKSEKISKSQECESPDKIPEGESNESNKIFRTPKKKLIKIESNSPSAIRTNNDKLQENEFEMENGHKTPEAPTNCNQFNKSDSNLEGSNEEEMISEIEQAKQLMVETENYLKALEKTPVKQVTSQSPQNKSKYSPGTPGRHKRANLITLDSPKAKKLKPDFN